MSTPQRIQRKRTRGWRMPDGAVYVGRPTRFGNVFLPTLVDGRWLVIDENGVDYEPYNDTRTSAAMKAVELYHANLTYWFGGRIAYDDEFRAAVSALGGYDLVCWCPLDQPCHADVLLELANQEQR